MTEVNNFELLDFTTQVVVAAIANGMSNPALGGTNIPALIVETYAALTACGQPAAAAAPAQEPAVSIRASVKPDAVTCLECGFSGKMLKRHLLSAHNLTGDEYRAKWNLPASHVLVAPNYALQRSDLARTTGLGRKPAAEPVAAPVNRARKG